jgi:hypothetical protein
MPVRGFGVAPPASFCLRLHMLGELLNQFFELHHQTPLLTFSMACHPNAR